jgi:hypothetical protein
MRATATRATSGLKSASRLRFLRVSRVELLLNGQIAFGSDDPSLTGARGTKFALRPATDDSSAAGGATP